MKRYSYKLVLSAPYETYTGPLEEGTCLSEGSRTHEGDPSDFIIREFLSYSKFSEKDQKGNPVQLRVELVELPMERAMSPENLLKLPSEIISWIDYHAEEALILLLKTMLDTYWEDEDFTKLKDTPLTATCQKFNVNNVWATCITIYVETIPVAMTLSMTGNEATNLKILDFGGCIQAMEIVLRNRWTSPVVEPPESSFSIAENLGIDLVDGQIAVRT